MGSSSTGRPSGSRPRPRFRMRLTPLVLGAVVALTLGIGALTQQIQPTAAGGRRPLR